MQYKCIRQNDLHQHLYNVIVFYNKLTDKVLHTHYGINLDNEITQKTIEDIYNNFLIEKQQFDRDDLEHIYICAEPNEDPIMSLANYYITNGELTKKYIMELAHDAIDNDNDGLPDIEGDGNSICNFTVTIKNSNDNSIATNINGLLRVDVSRGKILEGTSGIINFANGICNFSLRSVDETVRGVNMLVRVVKEDQQTIDQRIKFLPRFNMNYR